MRIRAIMVGSLRPTEYKVAARVPRAPISPTSLGVISLAADYEESGTTAPEWQVACRKMITG
jgi:hypothetical protein